MLADIWQKESKETLRFIPTGKTRLNYERSGISIRQLRGCEDQTGIYLCTRRVIQSLSNVL